MPTQNVRLISSLQFKDGSVYHGQVLDNSADAASSASSSSSSSSGSSPHGYGRISTPQGFTQEGYFSHGKSIGPGIFQAPNGDRALGQWNAESKREGKFLFVRSSDQLNLIEEWKSGALQGKRVKRRMPAASELHWWMNAVPAAVASAAPATASVSPPLASSDTGGLAFSGSSLPTARHGHTLTYYAAQSMIILYGGESSPNTSSSPSGTSSSLLSSELFICHLQNCKWTQPLMQGTLPPAMSGHCAVMIDSLSLLLLIGGQLQGLDANSSVYALNLKTGTWSIVEKASKSLTFINHTATYMHSSNSVCVLVPGGKCFMLSCDTWTWSEHTLTQALSTKTSKSFMGATCIECPNEDALLIIGGQVLQGSNSFTSNAESKKFERCISEVRRLDLRTMTLEAVATKADASFSSQSTAAFYCGHVQAAFDTPRAYHSATLISSQYLYIIGGMTTTNPGTNVVDESWLNDVQILDIKSMTWLPSLTQSVNTSLAFIAPRSHHTTVQVGSQLWTFGGKNAAHDALSEWRVLQLPTAAPPPSSDVNDQTASFQVHQP